MPLDGCLDLHVPQGRLGSILEHKMVTLREDLLEHQRCVAGAPRTLRRACAREAHVAHAHLEATDGSAIDARDYTLFCEAVDAGRARTQTTLRHDVARVDTHCQHGAILVAGAVCASSSALSDDDPARWRTARR
jgi:hypothetical protein